MPIRSAFFTVDDPDDLDGTHPPLVQDDLTGVADVLVPGIYRATMTPTEDGDPLLPIPGTITVTEATVHFERDA